MNTIAFVETRKRLSPAHGAEWMHVAGVHAAFDGVGSPLTRTSGLGLFDDASAGKLNVIETFYKQRGANTDQFVSPLANISLITLLNERGYQAVEFVNVLYRPIGPAMKLVPGLPDMIDVRLVDDPEREQWAQTAAAGWQGAPFDVLQLSMLNAQIPGALLFLAQLKAQPVATGRLFLSVGVALLVGASTIPAARNQGAQTALLQSRLRYAAENGCDVAAISALPGSTSQRNAERQGFRVAYTRVKWRRRTSADSAGDP
jgi:GNAT superfamily N-acetyltransferase